MIFLFMVPFQCLDDANRIRCHFLNDSMLLFVRSPIIGRRRVNEDVENTSKDAFLKTEKKISVCKELPVSDSMQKEAEEEASNGSADTKPGFDPSNEPFEAAGLAVATKPSAEYTLQRERTQTPLRPYSFPYSSPQS